MDVTFVPQNHHDWLMPLFACKGSEKLTSILKNNKVALSQCDLRFCVKILLTNQQLENTASSV